jgi:hypothetical protein
MKRLIAYTIATVLSAAAAHRASGSAAKVERHAEDAVLAAEDDWLAAELRGDREGTRFRFDADIPFRHARRKVSMPHIGREDLEKSGPPFFDGHEDSSRPLRLSVRRADLGVVRDGPLGLLPQLEFICSKAGMRHSPV